MLGIAWWGLATVTMIIALVTPHRWGSPVNVSLWFATMIAWLCVVVLIATGRAYT